jgi:hypothetical protein
MGSYLVSIELPLKNMIASSYLPHPLPKENRIAGFHRNIIPQTKALA